MKFLFFWRIKIHDYSANYCGVKTSDWIWGSMAETFPDTAQIIGSKRKKRCYSRWMQSLGICPQVKIKVNQTHYRHGQALRVPEGQGSQISWQSVHGGKALSPTHRPPLPPRKYSWYSFLSEAESTPGPCGRKEYVNEKFQWHHRESNPRPSWL